MKYFCRDGKQEQDILKISAMWQRASGLKLVSCRGQNLSFVKDLKTSLVIFERRMYNDKFCIFI